MTNMMNNRNDKIKIFICAHKALTDANLPSCVSYTIAAQNMNIKTKNNLPIIYACDEFTMTHTVSFGEACQLRYIWKNQGMLENAEYVGFCHYSRMFDFFNDIDSAMRTVDECGAICVRLPWYNEKNGQIVEDRGDNAVRIIEDHSIEYVRNLKTAVIRMRPDMLAAFNQMLQQKYLYNCNMFVMRRQDYLDMCEFIFNVMREFCVLTDSDGDVKTREYVQTLWASGKIGDLGMWHGINWQYRLHGFLVERLTHTFLISRFNESKLHVANCK